MAFLDDWKEKYKELLSNKQVQGLSRAAQSAGREFSSGVKQLGSAVGTAAVSPWENKRLQQEQRTADLIANTGRLRQARGADGSKYFNSAQRLTQNVANQQMGLGNRQVQAERDAKAGAFRTGLTVLGAGAGGRAIAGSALLGGGMGGLLSAATGQDVYEGIGSGVGSSMRYAGLNKLTAPLIDPFVQASGRFGANALGTIGKYGARAVAHGGANVLEDQYYTRLAESRAPSAMENLFSFGVGAAVSPMVNFDPKNSFIEIVDDKLTINPERYRDVLGRYAKEENIDLKQAKKVVDKWIGQQNEPTTIRIMQGDELVEEIVPKWRATMMDQPVGMSIKNVREGIVQPTKGDVGDIESKLKSKYPEVGLFDPKKKLKSFITTDGKIVGLEGEDAHYNFFGKDNANLDNYQSSGGIRINTSSPGKTPYVAVEINSQPTPQQIEALKKLPDDIQVSYDIRGKGQTVSSEPFFTDTKSDFFNSLNKYYPESSLPQPTKGDIAQSTVGGVKVTTFNARDKVRELAKTFTTEDAFKSTLDKEYVYFPKKGILMKTSEWNNIVKANQDSLKRNGIKVIKVIDEYGSPQPASSFLGDSLSSFYKKANVGRKLDSSRHLSDLFDLARKTDSSEFQDAVKNAPDWERNKLFSGVDAYKKEGGKNLTFEEIWDLANKQSVQPKPQSTVGGIRAKDVITFTDRVGKTTVGTVDHVGAMGLGSPQKVISVVDANGNKVKLSASELDSIRVVRKGFDTTKADNIDNYLLDTKVEFEKLRDSKELSQLNYYEHLRNKYQTKEITKSEFEKRLRDAKITKKTLEKSRSAAARFNELRELPTSQPQSTVGGVSLQTPVSRTIATTRNQVGEQSPSLRNSQNLGQGNQTIKQASQSIKVKPTSKDIISDGLNLVREAVYSGDEAAARAIYNTIDGKKPSFKSLVDEVSNIQDAEIKSVKKVSNNQYGEYEDVVKKFRTLLKRSGESVNDKGVLNREHIPVEKFGISSDEVATSLGMSEVDFMEQITKDLDMAGKGIATPQQLQRLDKNMGKIKNLVTKLGLDKDFYKINTDQMGRRLGVSAIPGGEMSPKTIRKVQTRSESAARRDFEQWQKSVVNQAGGNRTTRQAVDVIAKSMEQNTRGAGDISDAKDISNLSKGFNTVYRNFKQVFGDKYPEIKKQVLDPFDGSKGKHIDELNARADTLESDIVKGLNIEKGSKESAAVQLFGEGKKTKDDLVKEFGDKRADDIIQADKWFRQQYDQLLSEVNAVRQRIYPNNPDKIIPRRQDYYRHFREMREGFGALLNIFDSPGNIAPGLESISENTKPRAKWLSFAQKRIGDKSDIDAVGGFLDYIRASSYAKHIDPHIQVFRNLREDLVKATGNVEDPNYGKVNNFINFLDKYANDLSGKTNQADRVFQEYVPGGRKTFAALNWLNNRVKANVILGNVSSSLAQILNLPQGIASAGKYNAPGMGRTLKNIFDDDGVMKQSNFIKERYASDVFSRFDKGMLNNTKKFAVWMTQVLDEASTKYMWNAHYEKAIAENMQNPIKYADDVVRDMVGGRGIGEVPLLQKAKTFQLIAPFQLEVGNFWYVMKDMVDQKQFGKLATMFVASHVMNKGLEAVRGSGGSFDPIEAMVDMYGISQDSEDNKGLRMAGRGTGEILSNLPLGQTVAGAYPEYGFKVGEKQLPTREDLFGEGDPTRYGSGLLAMKGLQDPIYKVLPPFGGNQIKKTVTGLQSYNQGYSETKSGRVRFPIEKNPVTAIKSAAFGEYSTKDARKYFDKDTTPMGDNQTQTFKKLLLSSPEKAVAYYNSIMDRRGNDEVKSAGDATMQVYANNGNPLPKETDMLGVLYKKGKGVVDGYEEDKLLIENDPTLDYDEKVDKLDELDAKSQGWGSVVKRIEQERPEQILTLEVDQHVSGGGKTTEERAEWAYKKIYDIPQAKRADFVKRLLEEKVLTKSVVEAIKDQYGLLIPLYNEGGKVKRFSTGGGSKPKKLPDSVFKTVKLVRPRSSGSTPRVRVNRKRIPNRVTLKAKQVVKI